MYRLKIPIFNIEGGNEIIREMIDGKISSNVKENFEYGPRVI